MGKTEINESLDMFLLQAKIAKAGFKQPLPQL